MPNNPLSAYARGVLMITPLFLFLHFSNVARWQGNARTGFPSFDSSIFRVSAAELRTSPLPPELRAGVFEANHGQHGERARFFSRAGGYDLYLAADEAVLALRGSDGAPGGAIVKTRYVGACREVRLAGLEPRRVRVHYFVGSDPAGWRADVPTFGRVHYQGLYPGIDLLYGATAEQLEYGFVVAPGGNPARIELAFDGVRELNVDAEGDLRITTSDGHVIRMLHPSVHQERAGGRHQIAGGYELRDADKVGFRVASYDVTRPLVIGR